MDEVMRRRVVISEQNFMGSVEISFIRRTGVGKSVEHYDPDKRVWKIVPIEVGRFDNKPSMSLDFDDAVILYKKLHEFFSVRGVKNKDESFVQGELVATKRHMADLRRLLKLPTEVE